MNECHDLVYHGNGGFTWFEVWCMPIPHRKFNLNRINDYLEKVQQAQNKNRQVITENTDVKKEIIPKFLSETKDVMPTYSSKAKK